MRPHEFNQSNLRFLVRNIDVNAIDNSGRSALDYARLAGSFNDMNEHSINADFSNIVDDFPIIEESILTIAETLISAGSVEQVTTGFKTEGVTEKTISLHAVTEDDVNDILIANPTVS